MFTTAISTAARTAATGLVTIVLAVGTGFAVAGAEPQDSDFLLLLDQQGIGYSSPEDAISAAYLVCSEFDSGASAEDIGMSIIEQTDLSTENTVFFMSAAVNYYCPEHADELS